MATGSATHLLVTARYGKTSTSVWLGEQSVWGIRMGVWTGGAPSAETGDVATPSFTVADAAVTRSITNFTVSQGFTMPGTGEVITDADQDAIANAVRTFAVSAQAVAVRHVETQLQEIRLYPIGEDFKTVTAPSIYTLTSPSAGSGGTGMPQISLAVSLRSTLRGRQGRGRFYIPADGVGSTQITSGSLVASAVQTGIRDTAKTMCDTINDVGTDIDIRVIIKHRKRTGGALVNALAVGDEYDTQRRRRRGRKELYSMVAVAD